MPKPKLVPHPPRRWSKIRVRFDGAIRARSKDRWSVGERAARNLRGHLLVYVWTGRGWLYDGARDTWFNPGAVLWVRQGMTLFSEANSEVFDATFVHFELFDGDGPGAKPLPYDPYPPAVGMPCADQPFFSAAFAKLAHWTLLRPRHWRDGGADLLKSVLYELYAEAERGAPPPKDRLTMQGRRIPQKPLDRMRAAALAADPHAGEAFDELTGHLDRVSKPYWSRLFEREMGVTQREWVRRARLLQARWYLGRSTMGIPELAKRLGFARDHAFGRWFKQHAGVTPQAFRDHCDAHGAGPKEICPED